MLYAYFQIMAMLLPSAVSQTIKPENPNTVAEQLTELTQYVMETHMTSFNCIVLVLNKDAFYAPPPPFSNLVIVLDDENSEQLLKRIFWFKCQGWILQMKNVIAILDQLESARKASIICFQPRILFLPMNNTNYLSSLSTTAKLQYILDVVAAQFTSSESEVKLELFMNNFYSGPAGGFISIGYWPISSSVNLYPNKFENLHGKELRVATLQYPPFSLLTPDLDGLEIRTVKEFCQKTNCTIRTVTDEYKWGVLDENGTGNGIVGNIYGDKADMGVGAVYLWYDDLLQFSYSYMPSKIKVLVPKPSPIPEWRAPLAPFDLVMWITLFISIVTVALVLYITNNYLLSFDKRHDTAGEFQTLSGSFLRAVGMAVLQCPQNSLKSRSLRIIFTVFESLFLVYTVLYSGALSSVLTVPRYYPTINTIQDLYLSGLQWSADDEAWVRSLRDADEPSIQGILKNFKEHDVETLLLLAKKRQHGFTIECTTGGHVSEAEFLSADMLNNLHVMKEFLYFTYMATAMRKGSPYAEEFNKVLLRCNDAGLLLMWESIMLSKYGSPMIQTAFQLSKGGRQSNEGQLVKLKLKHVQGAFILLSMGLAAGTLSFLFEYLNILL